MVPMRIEETQLLAAMNRIESLINVSVIRFGTCRKDAQEVSAIRIPLGSRIREG